MKQGIILLWGAALPILLAVTGSGCASKKYVNQQINSVNQRVAQSEKQTNDKITYLNNKVDTDVSQLQSEVAATDKRVSQVAGMVVATDKRVDQVAGVVKEMQSSASRMAETPRPAPPLVYHVIESGDVLFGFDKATLTPDARRRLDAIVAKWQRTPMAIIELTGATDRIGSENYNLGLSRRRAWAVQKYLVERNVPPRAISLVGLGKDVLPNGLDSGQYAERSSSKSDSALARRVRIRMLRPGEANTASRLDQ